jgi:hypothetical protein
VLIWGARAKKPTWLRLECLHPTSLPATKLPPDPGKHAHILNPDRLLTGL